MKLYFTNLILFILSYTAFAQDPASSLFYLNKLYVNPAYAGINRDLSLSISHRNQWTSMVSNFTTYHVSADIGIPCRKLGIGYNGYLNDEGEGFLKTYFNAISIASHIPLNDDLIFSAALKFGIGQKRINWNRLVFSDQLDQIYGNIYQSNAVPAAESSNLILDAGFGGVIRKKWGSSNSFSSLGAAVHHANKPDESLMGIETELPRKYTFHSFHHMRVNSRYSMNAPQYLSFGMIYENQQELESFNFGVSSAFGSNLLLGVWYRSQNFALNEFNRDALIFNMNMFINRLVLGYTYDMTISTMGLSETKGSHEISLKFIFPDVYFCNGSGNSNKRRSRRAECYLFDMNKVANRVRHKVAKPFGKETTPWIYMLP